jgi:hypothetical protein
MAHRQQLFHQNGKKCPVGNFFDGDGKDSKGKRKINQPSVLATAAGCCPQSI